VPVPRSELRGALRRELEHRIRNGRCVYCRAPAAPDEPLTREHVIPRARGGRRKDLRIIVPACARCNQTRGCQEIVLFLLARPRRLTAFLDYLATLPPEVVREVDLRVFAELYAALGLLAECAARGREWRSHLEQLCTGRRLHRRRYAARRLLLALDARLERVRGREHAGPGCLLPGEAEARRIRGMERSCGELRASLIGVLSLMWEVPAERVAREIARETAAWEQDPGAEECPAEVVSLDGWKRRGRRRPQGDRRRGRSPRGRGRAA
jgi:hypothetical protein